MIPEYSNYLLDAASISQKYANYFTGIKLDEHTQAIEVFILQALNMCSSHCRASAYLLKNDYVGETAIVLRSIQELFFNIKWIQEPSERSERLERVYQLEADPYSRWVKETSIIGKHISQSSGEKMRGPIDDIAKKYTYLLDHNSDGTSTFKAAPSFASRMGKLLRAKYYHIYCYSSLFAHPSPYTKNLYLKMSDSTESRTAAFEEPHRQFIAYSLLFVELVIGYAEEILGPLSSTKKEQRDRLYVKMVELVNSANNNYFSKRSDDKKDNGHTS